MSVIHIPEHHHSCGPNRYGYWLNHDFDRTGTVRECECGKSWVAWEDRTDPGYMGVKWRREGRWARWRRTRSVTSHSATSIGPPAGDVAMALDEEEQWWWEIYHEQIEKDLR